STIFSDRNISLTKDKLNNLPGLSALTVLNIYLHSQDLLFKRLLLVWLNSNSHEVYSYDQ
ncbi:MAG TPA: hypothetical protein VF870_04370, partial [Ignavibacteriaceae bacterium]